VKNNSIMWLFNRVQGKKIHDSVLCDICSANSFTVAVLCVVSEICTALD
jgi:hypothetical protein